MKFKFYVKVIAQCCLFVLPWPLRRFLLCRFFSFDIHRTAHIGFAVILANRLEMGPKAKICNFVTCKPIDRLIMGEESGIGTAVYITGFPTTNNHHFQHVIDRRCELVLGQGVGITGRHYIDCNGGIYIGEFTTVAGLRSQILTHSIDIYQNRQHAEPVRIGKYCFVGTACVILPGATLPAYSVLGAGAVLNKKHTKEGFLYAGSPAMARKKLCKDEIPWMSRKTLGVK